METVIDFWLKGVAIVEGYLLIYVVLDFHFSIFFCWQMGFYDDWRVYLYFGLLGMGRIRFIYFKGSDHSNEQGI